MQCPACGTEVQPNTVFCHQCGERIDEEPAGKQVPTGVSETPRERIAGAVGRGKTGDDDREIEIWQGGYSPKAMYGVWIASGLASLVLLIVAVVAGAVAPWLWFVVPLAIVVLLGYPAALLVVRRMGVRYRLTSHRFFHERGILKRVTDRIEVIDIDDITFEQGVLERMFGVGTLRVVSSDRTHPELVMPGIDAIKEVARQMDDVRRAERRRRGLHIESI